MKFCLECSWYVLKLYLVVGKAEEAYKEANSAAEELPPTHPIRLGLVLNYSVFFYEIKTDRVKACELAKEVCTLDTKIFARSSPPPPRL